MNTEALEPKKSNLNMDKKGISFVIAIPILLVCMLCVTWYSGLEISEKQYKNVLTIAMQCERDTCDTIADSVSDGIITMEESLAIVLFQNPTTVINTDNPRQAIIDLVETDSRFRTKG